MTHAPLRIDDLSLSFPHKTCFDHFSARVAHASRIAIIGRNGCGKSSLLNMLMGNFGPGASGDADAAEQLALLAQFADWQAARGSDGN